MLFVGAGWENKSIYINQMANKYNKSKIILNFTRGNIGFSDRVFLAMGCRSLLISEYCKDLEKLFQKEIHLDWFKNTDELLNRINFYLENEVVREKVAFEGYKFVSENYTWEKITEKILKIVKKPVILK